MTLGEFREKTKNVPDNYNLIMSIYSEINGMDCVNEVDTMGCQIDNIEEEVLIEN